MTYTLFALSGVALFILRISLGSILVVYGWPKITNLYVSARKPNKKFSISVAYIALLALFELIGGLMLIVGLFTQIVGLLIAILMLIKALWKIKNRQIFVSGQEIYVALFAMGLILATSGGGMLALENIQSFQIH